MAHVSYFAHCTVRFSQGNSRMQVLYRALVRVKPKTNEGRQSLVWGWCRIARSGRECGL